MIAFVLLGLGLLGLYLRLQDPAVESRAIHALVLSWIGIGLTLPYYGAETFGLHAIGQEVVREKNPLLLSLVNSVRLQEGLVFFLPGLTLLAVGTVLFAIVTEKIKPPSKMEWNSTRCWFRAIPPTIL
jgi:hypothetical protein